MVAVTVWEKTNEIAVMNKQVRVRKKRRMESSTFPTEA
jgi:hypothetical protein